jgi:polyisoprenyl-phosphate glycosyltransferase
MISVIAPAFNEAGNIQRLYERLSAASLAWREDYEILIVDDDSHDDTLSICKNIAASDPRLKVISLSRNFGHQIAVSAGLRYAAGDLVAIIDADLQDPPEELHRFFAKCREGFDVVYAIRTKRKEGPFKRTAYFLFYRLLHALAAIDIPLDSGDFCVLTRRVVDALNALPERNRFVRGLRTWVGFTQTGMTYERQARLAGKPKYTFSKLVRLAMDGIVNFSYKPLQALVIGGLFMAGATLCMMVFLLLQYVNDWTILGYNPRQAKGWTSLMLTILFFASVQLIALGVIGEYLGRLFEEVKNRPLYLVKELVNLHPPPPADPFPGLAPRSPRPIN